MPEKGIFNTYKQQDYIRSSAFTRKVVMGTTVKEVKEGTNR
jgi:hypothetical protein